MKYARYDLFPTPVMTFHPGDGFSIDHDRMVDEIESQIELGEHMVKSQNSQDSFLNFSDTKFQSNAILWSDFQWSGSENNDWKILQKMFMDACALYFEHTRNVFNYVPFSYTPSSHAWFYKVVETKETFKYLPHVHTPASLSGIYYLKKNGGGNTRFYNNQNSVVNEIEMEDGHWCIFPGNLIHSGAYCSGNARYTIAADLFLGAL